MLQPSRRRPDFARSTGSTTRPRGCSTGRGPTSGSPHPATTGSGPPTRTGGRARSRSGASGSTTRSCSAPTRARARRRTSSATRASWSTWRAVTRCVILEGEVERIEPTEEIAAAFEPKYDWKPDLATTGGELVPPAPEARAGLARNRLPEDRDALRLLAARQPPRGAARGAPRTRKPAPSASASAKASATSLAARLRAASAPPRAARSSG